MTAAEKIVEYVRKHHNTRSDELMKLIAEHDAEREPEPIVSISEDGAPIFEYKTGTVVSVEIKKAKSMNKSVTQFSNELSDAELERLAILSEELGEAQQCIGKILRHGYKSRNPAVNTGRTNRQELEQELGDVRYAITLMVLNSDLTDVFMQRRVGYKAEAIQPYLHHQDGNTKVKGRVDE